jgi:hypothetical protein
LRQLTKTRIKAAEPRQKPYKLYRGKGLFILVMPDDRRWRRFRYRYLDREKTLSLGEFPEVGIEEAEEDREEFRRLLRAGIEPSAKCRAERTVNGTRSRPRTTGPLLHATGGAGLRYPCSLPIGLNVAEQSNPLKLKEPVRKCQEDSVNVEARDLLFFLVVSSRSRTSTSGRNTGDAGTGTMIGATATGCPGLLATSASTLSASPIPSPLTR